MNRKLLGGAVALAVILAGVWFFVLREKKSPAQKSAARSAEVAPVAAAPEKPSDAPAPQGRAPRWTLDEDREGTLQLEGQVQGPDGAAVGGAKVMLDTVPPRSTTSEDDGSFSFPKLTGRTYTLSASSGELVGQARYKLTDKGDPVIVRLGAGATIVVTVVDEAKKPIAKAKVVANDQLAAEQTTDDKGVATLKPMQPGWVGVTASASGFADQGGFTTIGSSGATGTVTIVLRKGYAVSGIVRDEAGAPIAKVKVRDRGGPWDFGGNAREPVITDGKGEFKITALAAGTHTLVAMDGEHAPASSAPFTLTERPLTGIEITMKSGVVLAGKVVTEAGAAAPFATVRIAGKGSNPWNQTSRQTTSDQAGAFELRGLAPGPVQARAESDVAASKVADLELALPGMKDVVLKLDVSGTIAGIVVDEKGAPVPEVQVNAFPDLFGGNAPEALALAGMSSATTDGGGAFVVHGLPDGKYRLWAARDADMFGDWGQGGVQAKVGDKGVKITLPAPGEVKGRIVLDGASSPPTPAYVQLAQQTPTPAGSDGSFALHNVQPGTYDITFRGPQFSEMVKRDIKIEPGKPTDLGDITVFRGRKLAGKVIDKAGAPIAGAKVKVGEMLFSAEGSEAQGENMEDVYGVRSAITDADGAFTIVGIPKKATTAVAEHTERGRSAGVSIPAGSDDVPPVTLLLRGFGSITGTVTTKGKPLGGVTVSQSTKNGGATASFAQTNDDGTFVMARVPEGEVVLQAIQQKMMAMRTHSITTTVVAGKATNVVIDIPVGAITLTVNVVPRPGNEVNAAQIFLYGGVVDVHTGKELTEGMMSSSSKGMQFWMGKGMPMPSFEQLVEGVHSACVIPITGNMADTTFTGRLQENIGTLAIYCKQITLTPAPTAQSITVDVPAMNPLPPPT